MIMDTLIIREAICTRKEDGTFEFDFVTRNDVYTTIVGYETGIEILALLLADECIKITIY